MTPSSDTWGISGPLFLVAYLVLAVAVVVAVTVARRRLADVPAERTSFRLDDRPYDVAYLNGGADLALCATLSALHRGGLIESAGRGLVVASGRPESRADELERAVHHTATRPASRRRLAASGIVASALHRIEARLLAQGLLLTAERRQRIRYGGFATLAVAVLGVVRILAGFAGNRPVGFLTLAVIAVTAVGGVQVARTPRRSRAGDAALHRLTQEHHLLSPSMRPDWAVYGPAGAAMAVGVFGIGSLWASDPAFAGELALQRATALSGSGYVGTSSSGDAGGGGGSSCGGGGGGCGGGGCGG